MHEPPYNVLFLCTGNSARSILAERLLEHHGGGRFRGYSAGSHPRGSVHPLALELLRELNLPTEGLRSKGLDEFARAGAPTMDLVITVCDDAAGEACPVWPGDPATAHWGVEDPAEASGTAADRRRAFREALHELEGRIRLLTRLPLDSLERPKLEEAIREIGRGG